jgi:hypothetical protein
MADVKDKTIDRISMQLKLKIVGGAFMGRPFDRLTLQRPFAVAFAATSRIKSSSAKS